MGRRAHRARLRRLDPWYIADVYGGVLLDDVHDMAVYDNVSRGSAASTRRSCGNLATNACGMGTRSAAIDTSLDTLGTTYTSMNFDACIPHGWQ